MWRVNDSFFLYQLILCSSICHLRFLIHHSLLNKCNKHFPWSAGDTELWYVHHEQRQQLLETDHTWWKIEINSPCWYFDQPATHHTSAQVQSGTWCAWPRGPHVLDHFRPPPPSPETFLPSGSENRRWSGSIADFKGLPISAFVVMTGTYCLV